MTFLLLVITQLSKLDRKIYYHTCWSKTFDIRKLLVAIILKFYLPHKRLTQKLL